MAHAVGPHDRLIALPSNPGMLISPNAIAREPVESRIHEFTTTEAPGITAKKTTISIPPQTVDKIRELGIEYTEQFTGGGSGDLCVASHSPHPFL